MSVLAADRTIPAASPEDATAPVSHPAQPASPGWAHPSRLLRLQCACTALVALAAAYVSYRHGHDFALRFGADETTALLWPLVVDGLLTMATIELWKTSHHPAPGGQWKAWLAFTFGIALSLCANLSSAPEPSTFAITVAACPPLALLLSVELLNQALKRHHTTHTTTRATGAAAAGAPAEPAPQCQVPAQCTVQNNTPGHTAGNEETQPATSDENEDPLRHAAYQLDAEHWNQHHRPISAETLRRSLSIGSRRARALTRQVRQHHQPATALAPATT